MAITPPADIVLDVARAADPDKYRAAVERLARIRATAASSPVFIPPDTPPAPAVNSVASDPRVTTTRPLEANGGNGDRRLDAYGKFEAFVLQTFVQSMLPKDAASVFGSGTAGEFWKSMLAEKMGSELARSGQVGIASRLAAAPRHAAQPANADLQGSISSVPPPASMLVGAPQLSARELQIIDAAGTPDTSVGKRS